MASNKTRSIRTARVARPAAGAAGRVIAALLKIAGTILLMGICTGLLFACVFAVYIKTSIMPNVGLNFNDFALDLSSVIYCKDPETGEYIELTTIYGEENRDWVDYKDMPAALSHAAVAIEDHRFYDHNGVDWYRTIAAFGNMFLGMKDTFGGSTITQQLIKITTQYDDVTVQRKIIEIFNALDVEKRYTKEEILELYLNTIYLGEGCYGVGTASYKYFGKDVSELTVAECASLIGITNNPSMFDPYINEESNIKRQQTIIYEMYDKGYIKTEQEYLAAKNQKLVFVESEDEDRADDVYSYFVDTIIRDVKKDLMVEKGYSEQLAILTLYRGGLQIYATIDLDIQEIVDGVYEDIESLPKSYRDTEAQLQSAIVIQNPYTGDIVALSGGVGEKTGSLELNRATQSERPPGSSIKPISVYSPALELGFIEPYTIFDDNADIVLSGTNWFPDNDNYENNGVMTVRHAVRRSVNTVAAQIVDLLTPQVSFEFLRDRFGLTTLVEDKELSDGTVVSDRDYAPMALGQLTYGATVRDMTAAYTAFANKGIYTEGRTYTHILDADGNMFFENKPESHVAVSEGTAYQMTSMMRGAVTGGTASAASFPNMFIAGKTGSSSSWQDRWFVGFTPYYVATVWCGYDTPEHLYFYGNPSCQLWKRVMEKVHEGLEYKEFALPEGMVKVSVCIDSGKLATEVCEHDIRGSRVVSEYVLSSEAPTSLCDCHTYVELCKDSGMLPNRDCPDDHIIRAGVLDPSVMYKLLTPQVFDPDDEAKQIYYVLGDIPKCTFHLIDPETGWRIDAETGYLVTPYNDKRLYDPLTGKYYDAWTGWEIDIRTGMIINPETGVLIDPYTGQEYIPPEVTEPPDDDTGDTGNTGLDDEQEGGNLSDPADTSNPNDPAGLMYRRNTA